TYRKLAQHALRKILPRLGREPKKWTSGAPLPGGDMPGADFAAFLRALMAEYPFLPSETTLRYARLYGTRARALLKDARKMEDLGRCLGADLYEREVAFLRTTEWAESPEDMLWRRTKLGLVLKSGIRPRPDVRVAPTAAAADALRPTPGRG